MTSRVERGSGRRRRGLLLLLAGLLALAPRLAGQQAANCMVIPFDNRSGQPSLEWLSEGFSESMGEALENAGVEVLNRQERAAAFDQAGIPLLPTLSLATLMHVAGDADAHWLILGSFTYDGTKFGASAEVIDLVREHMTRIPAESGPLADLETIQQHLAQALLRSIEPAAVGPAAAHPLPRVVLPAYENYIRSLLAADAPTRLKLLQAAVRLQPDYSRAIDRLGQWYFDHQEYAQALLWLPRVSRLDQDYWGGQFLAGRAAWQLGQYPRAVAFFREIADRLPLTGVLNNLGVALAETHPLEAVPVLRRALQQNPADLMVQENLAIALALAGNSSEAQTRLAALDKAGEHDRVAPLLAALEPPPGTAPDTAVLARQLRLEANFPADSFRQLEAAIVQFDAAKARSLPGGKRLKFHLEQGAQLMSKGALDGAEREYEAALREDAQSVRAHAGLAQVALARHQWEAARQQAARALALGPSLPAHLVLAHVDVAEGQRAQAQREIDAVLAADPNNPEALELRRQLQGAAH